MALSIANLKGTWPALVTPFSADGTRVDYESLAALIDWHARAGVSGFVVCGSTGEAGALSAREYSEVISFVVKTAAGRLPCIAGAAGASTDKTIEQALLLRDLGVDGILLAPTPYNKPPQSGIAAHFARIREASGLPIVAYNVPGRTAVNILPQTTAQLANDGIIIGLKDASGSLDQMLDTAALVGQKISILSGEDSLVHPIIASGGKGVISASANVVPETFVEITSAALSGRYDESLRAQLRVLPVVRAMFAETNPIPVKTALALRGVIKHAAVRLPLMPATGATIDAIKKALQI